MFAIPQQMRALGSLQLYFQQILPLAKCGADDGRVVGHLLVDLLKRKPKDLAHAIREFADRVAMLRECGLHHIGDFLAALFTITTTAEPAPSTAVEPIIQDPACVSVEQAAAIGRIIVERARSGVPLLQIVELHSVTRKMKSRYPWFVPMLEVLLAETAGTPLQSIGKRFSATVSPQAMVPNPLNANFGSVVRSPPGKSCLKAIASRRS
jgi:hypothetical protein